jgi:hypothetical protein
VKGHAGDVGCVAVKGQDSVGVGRLDVVELDRVVASGSEVSLVGRYAKAVYLRVWVWDGARANAAEGFPEALGWLLVAQRMVGGFVEVYRIVWSYPAAFAHQLAVCTSRVVG